jgi:hypothetical protein
MPNEFIARNGITSLGNVIVSGSITATGAINMSGSIASASFAASASNAVNAQTASYVLNAVSASYILNAQSASNAVSAATASSADNFLARGTITAQTIVVQTITSSVDFVTGSTRFGSILGNTHVFTGSMSLTGSLTVVTTGTEFQVNANGVKFGNVIGDAHSITGSVGISGSLSGVGATFSSDVTATNLNLNGLARIQNQTTGGYLSLYGNTGGLYLGAFSGSGNQNYMFISASSGNVGIGTTSPTARLEIRTFIDEDHGLKVTYAAASNGRAIWINQPNGGGGGGATQALIYANNSGNNPYVTFDSVFTIQKSGNVGIGTSSPNGNLEVYSSTPIIISGASSSGTLHGLEFRQSNTIDAYIKQLPATGELRLYVGRNSSWGGNMTFWTDTVQRMFISSGGEVSIRGAGGTQTAFSIYDGGTRRFFCIPNQYYGYIFGGQIAANNGKYFSFGNDAGNEVGFIQITATGVNYTSNSSDIRKKKNFENWEETVLPYFENINPQKFNYTIEEDGQSKTKGFIAQEMYDKFPEAYPLDLDGFHSFNPGGMVVYLIKAIQELEARVQELENK